MAIDLITSLAVGNDIHIFATSGASCSTASTTAAKVATVNGDFSLVSGMRVIVKFTNANAAASPTLNINNTGAKPIFFRGAALTSPLYYWAAGSMVEFVYDGTQWQMLGAPDNINTAGSDTKVTQTSTTSGTYPILLTNTASPTSGSAAAARYDTDVKVNTATGSIIAPNVTATTDLVFDGDYPVTISLDNDDGLPNLYFYGDGGFSVELLNVLVASDNIGGPGLTYADSSPTTTRIRGQSLNAKSTTVPTVPYNGAIAWVYE